MNKVNTLSNLLDWITKTEQNSVNAIRRLLSYTAEKYSPHKDDVIKEYDLTREERFNIFETISDQYQKEKFHSDVLYSILNPGTPEIGTIYNKEILEKFVKMVDSSFEFIVDDTVKVSKEESNKVLNGDFEKQ
ncbi:MAG: PD-(D/E)XK nuclease family protein, partial [Treponema sp.]|nr:PD-(D/E)XK nuclease family protein [Treponema sp.]